MSGHLQQFVKGARSLKLKELGPYAAKYYRENLTYSKLQPQVAQGLEVIILGLLLLLSLAWNSRLGRLR